MRFPGLAGVCIIAVTACHSPKADAAKDAARMPSAPASAAKASGVKPNPQQTDVAAEDFAVQPLPWMQLSLVDAYGTSHALEVELADNANARTRGLMWRRELAEGKGMLFVFPDDRVQSFWMRNTFIPLDMIFIGTDGKIVGVIENVPPQTLQGRSVGKPSPYVLEVPAGWVAKRGIRPNSPVAPLTNGLLPAQR